MRSRCRGPWKFNRNEQKGKIPPRPATPSYNLAVMISQELLDILVCPVCKKPLVLKVDPEVLKCNECRRVYPVRDNIPVLLIDQATIDPF